MGKINAPSRVKLFCGLIFSGAEHVERARAMLSEHFGPIDLESEQIPFDFTAYYEQEMGKNLTRQWISFDRLVSRDELSAAKLTSNRLEETLSAAGGRKVNIDPGYLTSASLILASSKDFSHRVYLKDGIYGEVTMHYKNESFHALPWTYPDYQFPRAQAFFKTLRERYRAQLKQKTPL